MENVGAMASSRACDCEVWTFRWLFVRFNKVESIDSVPDDIILSCVSLCSIPLSRPFISPHYLVYVVEHWVHISSLCTSWFTVSFLSVRRRIFLSNSIPFYKSQLCFTMPGGCIVAHDWKMLFFNLHQQIIHGNTFKATRKGNKSRRNRRRPFGM